MKRKALASDQKRKNHNDYLVVVRRAEKFTNSEQENDDA